MLCGLPGGGDVGTETEEDEGSQELRGPGSSTFRQDSKL